MSLFVVWLLHTSGQSPVNSEHVPAFVTCISMLHGRGIGSVVQQYPRPQTYGIVHCSTWTIAFFPLVICSAFFCDKLSVVDT